MRKNFLGGLSNAEFLRRHWQKKPLLAREALRGSSDIVTRDDLVDLAQRDDVESRIVTSSGGRWHVRHGPFRRRDIARLPREGWTLLVQGVDQVLWQAARLLREFAFIPYARLDDIMVSYAAPGGGVGPHFDSYDVFLLQGSGKRRWRVSRQRDLDLVPGAPLKILQRFRPEDEWLVEPGDLLYLPPRCAHEGVALGACITYSIGFRAPSAQELGARFLEFLQDQLEIDGMYSDPDLQVAARPARIPPEMVRRSAAMLDKLRWTKSDVVRFLGCYLTEPKAQVVFARPKRAATPAEFERRAGADGIRLAPATRMLFQGRRIFVNGESFEPAETAARSCAKLADARELRAPLDLDGEARALLYDWYRAGYIALGADRQR